MKTPSEPNYRDNLRSELRRRQAANPRYSLRAFAKALSLSPQFLSNVMNGRKGLSPTRALAVAGRLGYSELESAQFCSTPASCETDSDEFTTLNLDAFQVVSDWYHYALLELSLCRGFNPDPRAIAQNLGITREEAHHAIDRLVRLGLMRKKGQTYIKTDRFIATPTDRPNPALRHFHAQMIEKAKQALESQAISERSITGMTIAIDPGKLDLAKRELQKFQKRMAKLMDGGAATEVYQLNTQFFRLSNSKRKSE